MTTDKQHIRHFILHEFLKGKKTLKHGIRFVLLAVTLLCLMIHVNISIDTNISDFDLSDQECPGQPPKFKEGGKNY